MFSTGGAAIKACALTGWQVAGFRSAIAAALLYLLFPNARRGWSRYTALTGAAYAATLISFVLANKLTTSANAIFLQSTGPLYLLFLGPAVLREKVTARDFSLFAVILAGAALILFGSAGATDAERRSGDLLGLFSGLAWAATLTGLRWVGKKDPNPDAGTATVILGNIIAFAACLPWAMPVHQTDPASLMVLVYLGACQVGLAYVLLTRSIRHVPAFPAATLMLIEPVFNPVWTWLFRGERPGTATLLGGSVILAASLLAALCTGQQKIVPASTVQN